MENQVKYVPTRREVASLVIDNYLFQRVSASTNKDGSIGWRCKEYRRESRCQSTCRIGVNGEIIRPPGPHNHEKVPDAMLVFMKAKSDAKKRCRSESGASMQKIFLEEMGKAIKSSGLQLDDSQLLPTFDKPNKRSMKQRGSCSDNEAENYKTHEDTKRFKQEWDVESEERAFGLNVDKLIKKERINRIITELWDSRRQMI